MGAKSLSREQFEGAAGPVTHAKAPTSIGGAASAGKYNSVASAGKQNMGSVGSRTAWKSGGGEPGSVMPHTAQGAGTFLNFDATRAE